MESSRPGANEKTVDIASSMSAPYQALSWLFVSCKDTRKVDVRKLLSHMLSSLEPSPMSLGWWLRGRYSFDDFDSVVHSLCYCLSV